MSIDSRIILNDIQITEIKTLASETRQLFGVYPNVPVGNDIKMILEKKGILLCEYPFSESGDTHTYGNIVMFKTEEKPITFIGLNTASFYDEQIFALAHEIYHFSTKTGMAYTSEHEEDKETEKKADRFAAEFLLPAEVLKEIVISVFANTCLQDVPDTRLLRFVARLQCDWWLPYQSIINRLYEENHITKAQYDNLYNIDCRSEVGTYRKILKSTDNEISELLNTKTKTIGVSSRIIDTIINNYEDGFIEYDELFRILTLLGKKPDDYGIQVTVELDEDLEEIAGSEDNK